MGAIHLRGSQPGNSGFARLAPVQARVTLEDGSVGTASAPAVRRLGQFEALELRDDGALFRQGVRKAVSHVEGEIRAALLGGRRQYRARRRDSLRAGWHER